MTTSTTFDPTRIAELPGSGAGHHAATRLEPAQNPHGVVFDGTAMVVVHGRTPSPPMGGRVARVIAKAHAAIDAAESILPTPPTSKAKRTTGRVKAATS